MQFLDFSGPFQQFGQDVDFVRSTAWFILIQPVSMIPWLLNWIIYWIESPQFFLNWIIVWIEFWETNIESIIELNPFLPKFKLWIESFWVSIMAKPVWKSQTVPDLVLSHSEEVKTTASDLRSDKNRFCQSWVYICRPVFVFVEVDVATKVACGTKLLFFN